MSAARDVLGLVGLGLRVIVLALVLAGLLCAPLIVWREQRAKRRQDDQVRAVARERLGL